jgi:hypothetical protein
VFFGNTLILSLISQTICDYAIEKAISENEVLAKQTHDSPALHHGRHVSADVLDCMERYSIEGCAVPSTSTGAHASGTLPAFMKSPMIQLLGDCSSCLDSFHVASFDAMFPFECGDSLRCIALHIIKEGFVLHTFKSKIPQCWQQGMRTGIHSYFIWGFNFSFLDPVRQLETMLLFEEFQACTLAELDAPAGAPSSLFRSAAPGSSSSAPMVFIGVREADDSARHSDSNQVIFVA